MSVWGGGGGGGGGVKTVKSVKQPQGSGSFASKSMAIFFSLSFFFCSHVHCELFLKYLSKK